LPVRPIKGNREIVLGHGVDVNYGKPVDGNENNMSSYLYWVEWNNNISATSGYYLKVTNTLGGANLLYMVAKKKKIF